MFIVFLVNKQENDHEVEFQEIKSLKSIIFEFRSPENFCTHNFDHEINSTCG
jgi:hypothetical protein